VRILSARVFDSEAAVKLLVKAISIKSLSLRFHRIFG